MVTCPCCCRRPTGTWRPRWCASTAGGTSPAPSSPWPTSMPVSLGPVWAAPPSLPLPRPGDRPQRPPAPPALPPLPHPYYICGPGSGVPGPGGASWVLVCACHCRGSGGHLPQGFLSAINFETSDQLDCFLGVAWRVGLWVAGPADSRSCALPRDFHRGPNSAEPLKPRVHSSHPSLSHCLDARSPPTCHTASLPVTW